MQMESEAPNTLDMFIHDVGVPPKILTDNAKVLSEGKLKNCV